MVCDKAFFIFIKIAYRNFPIIKEEYTVTTENRFEALLQIADEDKRPDELMTQIKDIFLETAEEKLGKRKGKKKKP